MVVFCLFYSYFFNKCDLITAFIPNSHLCIRLFSSFYAIAAPIACKYSRFCKPHPKKRNLFLTD